MNSAFSGPGASRLPATAREMAEHRVTHVGAAREAADCLPAVLRADALEIRMRQLDQHEVEVAVQVRMEVAREIANVDRVMLEPALARTGAPVERAAMAGGQRHADQEAAVARGHVDVFHVRFAHAFAVQPQAAGGGLDILRQQAGHAAECVLRRWGRGYRRRCGNGV